MLRISQTEPKHQSSSQGFQLLSVREITEVHSTPATQQNMFLHHFLPGTFIFTSSHPSPIYSPLFLSPVAHTIPQTNQFASLLSLLPSMPGPALSFVSRRYLHFRRPRINLSLMPPSITPPTNLPSPRPTYSFQGAQSIDSPATSDYHAVSVRSSVCECVRMRFVG